MHRLRNIAVVLMIGTLGVFLFPAAAGPFTTTNGPVTAFRAAAAALALLLSITRMVPDDQCLQRRTNMKNARQLLLCVPKG